MTLLFVTVNYSAYKNLANLSHNQNAFSLEGMKLEQIPPSSCWVNNEYIPLTPSETQNALAAIVFKVESWGIIKEKLRTIC